MSDPTSTKAPSPQLARVVWLPTDRADRLRALQKVAARAAAGSAVHWRRLKRLPEADKVQLWETLSSEVKDQLRIIKTKF